MNNKVLLLWLEGVDPDLLATVPCIAELAATGVDLQLLPLPLVERRVCYYQTLTGMGAGKIGRFDALRPQNYHAYAEAGVPEGVMGRLLPELLRSRKQEVTYIETDHRQTLDMLIGQIEHCTIVRLLNMQLADAFEIELVVRRCIELAGPEAHVVVLTDVYEGDPHTLVNVNDFLADVGLLEVGDPRNRESIVWSETLAYSLGAGQIWINLRGRETEGLVASGKEYQEVCNALINELSTNWLDPRTNKPVVARVIPREDAYTGEYLFKAPDLIIVYHQGYLSSPKGAALDFDGKSLRQVTSPANAKAAYARMVAHGPCLKKGISGDAQLIDVVPNLLYLLGLSIPAHIDGNVFLSMFTQNYSHHNPIRRLADGEDLLSDEEEGLIVDRLRDLGYLG